MASRRSFANIHVYFLALTAYCGIFLFGWETGVAGGVVSQAGFREAFGVANNKKAQNAVSANVVSVLQAGAFFSSLCAWWFNDRLGRRYSLFIFNCFTCEYHSPVMALLS